MLFAYGQKVGVKDGIWESIISIKEHVNVTQDIGWPEADRTSNYLAARERLLGWSQSIQCQFRSTNFLLCWAKEARVHESTLLYNSMYMTFKIKPTSIQRKQIRGCLRRKEGIDHKVVLGKFMCSISWLWLHLSKPIKPVHWKWDILLCVSCILRRYSWF